MKRIVFFLCFAFASIAHGQVVVNEVCAANRDVWTDNYGNDSDWFELYNSGAAAVNLEGYFLTDNPDNLAKWEIPAGMTINPGETMLIWASGRDEVIGGDYHADFKLTQMRQESVILSDPTLTILDEFTYTDPNQLGHSRGRLTDGGAVWGVFEDPTPGASNTGGVSAYAPTPEFSLDAGLYAGAQSVSITTEPGFEIRYTLDGTVPDELSTLYTGAITIDATTTIRARSFTTGGDELGSFNATNTYFINETHTFSTYSVSGNLDPWGAGGGGGGGGGWGGGGGVNYVAVEFFSAAGDRIWVLEGEMRPHGNDSWAYDQKGMRLHVHDEYGYANKIDHQMFAVKDRTDFDVIIIKAAGSDNSPSNPNIKAHLRDGWVQTVSHNADLDVDERTYEHCLNYLNGQYWGVYEYRERIDSDFTSYYYNNGGSEVDMLEQWGGVDIEYGSLNDWEDTYDFITNNDMSNQALFDQALTMIDRESFLDYMILNTYFVNSDWLNWNTKWWRGYDADNPMLWRYCLWDMDNVCDLGQNFTGWSSTGWEAPTVCEVAEIFGTGSSWNADVGHSEIYRNLLENEGFFQDYINRYTDLLNGPLHCDALTALLDQFEADMLPEMQRHCDRWGGSVAQWQESVDDIRQFNCNRYDFVYEVIQDCFPELDGPYNVTVQVDGVGELLFSTTSVTDIFEGTYFGGITIELDAIETCGGIFTGWEVISGDAVLADPTAFQQEINLTSDLVIQGTFVPNNEPIDIFFDTEPTTFGGIMVDGTEIAVPGTYTYPAGTQLELTAIESGFEFFNDWEIVEEDNAVGDLENDVTITYNVCEEDSIIADFDVEISEDLYFNVIPDGAGTIDAEGVLLTNFPITEPFAIDQNIDLVATPSSAIYEFVEWQINNHVLNPDNFSDVADFDFIVPDSIVAVFQLVPTFTVDLEMTDPDAGTFTVNGETNEDGSFIIEENGTVTIEVTENEWYEFLYWETSDGIIIDGNDTDALNDFIINGDGTITAVFNYIEHWDITIDVIGSGTVTLNGTELDNLPFIETYIIDDELDLTATPVGEWWVFSHWEIGGQSVTPDNLAEAITVAIQNGDSIVAVFIELENYEITVQVEPREAGTVTFGEGISTTNTWEGTLAGGTPINFTAFENPFFEFVGWRTVSHTPNPDYESKDVSFTFNEEETVVAVFERIEFVHFIPNSFSPDNNGLNEVWMPEFTAVDETSYECIVFNRLGEVVFRTTDPNVGWNGSHEEGDYYVPDGVYQFVITAKSIHEPEVQEIRGHITVLR